MTATITDPKSVKTYCQQVMQMRALLENMTELLDTMPAPDDDENVIGFDYGQLGTINQMHTYLTAASECADELND